MTTIIMQEPYKPLIIINADDYGISEKVSLGILEALGSSSITTTSVMVNMPCFGKMAAAIKGTSFDYGLHLNLTAGSPVSECKMALDRDGCFRSLNWFLSRYFTGRLGSDAIKKEISAQFEKFIAVFGRPPSHVDSHHHVHMFQPVWEIVRKEMVRYKIPFLRNSVEFTGHRSFKNFLLKYCSASNDFAGIKKISFSGHNLLGQQRVMKLPTPPPGVEVFEWMVHCGFSDIHLSGFDGYIGQRQEELAFLKRPDVMQALRERFTPISFASLV